MINALVFRANWSGSELSNDPARTQRPKMERVTEVKVVNMVERPQAIRDINEKS